VVAQALETVAGLVGDGDFLGDAMSSGGGVGGEGRGGDEGRMLGLRFVVKDSVDECFVAFIEVVVFAEELADFVEPGDDLVGWDGGEAGILWWHGCEKRRKAEDGQDLQDQRL
jgi:hypothetical protein